MYSTKKGGLLVRSDYIQTDTISHLLWALMPCDKIICEVALATGWRIDDILNIKTEQVVKALKKKRPSITIIEKKTKKHSTKYLSKAILEQMFDISGRVFVFEGRDDYRKHRSRQAVFLDLKRAAKRFNLKISLSPHSLRKNYAVYLRQQGYSLTQIQEALNHDNALTTMLYAFADEMSNKFA